MTASILLRIVVLDSENYYIKNPREVKHKFTKPEIFCKNESLAIFFFIFYTDKNSPRGRSYYGKKHLPCPEHDAHLYRAER